MKQDEIIEMAREAGLNFYNFVWTSPTKENLYPEGVNQEALEAFAKLVAAKEREACAMVAQKTVCDTHIPTGVRIYGTSAAKAIRARGEA